MTVTTAPSPHPSASQCSAALTLMKNNSVQAWISKTCTHTSKFHEVKATGVLFVMPVTLLNFYDKCSMANSSPPPSVPWSLQLLSSEVEPHYYSTTWESPPPHPGEIWQLLNPSILLSPYCGQCWIETEPGSDQSSSRHVCNASSAICCGCWFLCGPTVYKPKPI